MIGTIGRWLAMAIVKKIIWPRHIRPAIESIYKNKDAVAYARLVVLSVNTRNIESNEVRRMTAFGELKERLKADGTKLKDHEMMLALEAAIKATKVGWK